MEKEYGRIYLITNIINGKQYIGQTVSTLKIRWKRHTWRCTVKNPRMAITHAIKKYGKENFIIEEIQTCYDQEELDNMEKYLIKILNTLAPYGYNLLDGGKGNGKMSEETKEKIRQSKLGKKLSDEHRKNLSLSHMGQKISEKERQRRRDFMKGKQPNELARKNAIKTCSKTYELIDPNGNEITITNMAKYCRDNKHSKGKMCKLVRGHIDTYKGFVNS